MASLAEALKAGRLEEFVEQEESRGVGPINRAILDAHVAVLVKAPQSKDQTSQSSSDDGLIEKRSRRDNEPHTSR